MANIYKNKCKEIIRMLSERGHIRTVKLEEVDSWTNDEAFAYFVEHEFWFTKVWAMAEKTRTAVFQVCALVNLPKNKE